MPYENPHAPIQPVQNPEPINPNISETPTAINQKEKIQKNAENKNINQEPEAHQIQIKTTESETSAQESPAALLNDIETIVAGTEEQLPAHERGDNRVPPGLATEKPMPKSIPNPEITLPLIEKSFEEKIQLGDEGEAARVLTLTVNEIPKTE